MAESLEIPVVGVLDEPYTQLCKPAQLSSHTGPPGYIGWTLGTSDFDKNFIILMCDIKFWKALKI
jgi:hypothetical protein